MLTYASAHGRKAVRVLEDATQRNPEYYPIANLLGISRQAVSKALPGMDEKIESTLREMAQANQIMTEKINAERGVLVGRSIPFKTAAIIFVPEKHGTQVWYEHDGDWGACQRYTECIESVWDYASGLGIRIEKSADPAKMAEGTFYEREGAVMTLIRLSEIIRGWLGWCPNARILKTSQAGISAPPLGNPTILPDGGSSGSERIRRGKDVATESIKILVRNRRLLWFSFLMLLTFIVAIVTDLVYRGLFPGRTHFPAL